MAVSGNIMMYQKLSFSHVSQVELWFLVFFFLLFFSLFFIHVEQVNVYPTFKAYEICINLTYGIYIYLHNG